MNENVILVVDYEKICRLCLHTTGAMSDLFENNKGNTLKDSVLRATGLEVKQHDGFPNKICYKCRYIVELNCELRDMVAQTNALLENAGNLQTTEEQGLAPERETNSLPDAPIKKLQINKEKPDLRLIMQDDGVMALTSTVKPDPGTPVDEKPSNIFDWNIDVGETKLEDKRKEIKIEFRSRNAPPKHLTCQICLTTFHTSEEVDSHVDVHYKDSSLTPYTVMKRPFQCELCDRAVSKRQLVLHHRIHLNVNPFVCKHEGCKFVGKNQDSFRRHLASHSARTQVCEMCGASYKRRFELRQHVARAHRPAPAQCRVCRKRFRNAITLKAHLQQYHKPRRFKCEWVGCGKSYHSAGALSVHARGHTEQRDYRCKLCDRAAYTSQSLLNRHLRMHERSRISKCDRCSATFDDFGEFYKHRVAAHGHWLGHKCKGCGKRFQTQPALENHMATCDLALGVEDAAPTDSNSSQLDSIQEMIDSEGNGLQLATAAAGVEGGGVVTGKFKGQSLIVQPVSVGHLDLQDIPPDGLLYIEVDPDEDDVNNAWQH